MTTHMLYINVPNNTWNVRGFRFYCYVFRFETVQLSFSGRGSFSKNYICFITDKLQFEKTRPHIAPTNPLSKDSRDNGPKKILGFSNVYFLQKG